MDLRTLTYIVVGATFALYFAIAIWSRAASTGEFYAAGRGRSSGRQRDGNGGRLDVGCVLHLHGRSNRVLGL